MTVYPFAFSAAAPLTASRGQVDRLLNEVFAPARRDGQHTTAPADVSEDATAFYLDFDMAGVDAESLQVMVEDALLTVHAAKAAPVVDGRRVVLRERTFGTVERKFRLPKTADGSAVNASYVNGVLSIRIAKVAPVQPRRVEITVGGFAPEAAGAASAAAGGAVTA